VEHAAIHRNIYEALVGGDPGNLREAITVLFHDPKSQPILNPAHRTEAAGSLMAPNGVSSLAASNATQRVARRLDHRQNSRGRGR
jgi:hypothetical protein